MLELINPARLDPLAEATRLGIGLNDGQAAGTLVGTARQVLAPNRFLDDSAQDQSIRQLGHDLFSHTGVSGSSAGDRMASAGCAFSGNWTWAETISRTGTAGTLDPTGAIPAQHDSLFISAGHRQNILSDAFREIGTGQEIGMVISSGAKFNASMVTQNFARSGSAVLVTGVACDDADQDGFHSLGEGVANAGHATGGTSTKRGGLPRRRRRERHVDRWQWCGQVGIARRLRQRRHQRLRHGNPAHAGRAGRTGFRAGGSSAARCGCPCG